MRRLIWWLDVMTISTLSFTGYYMYGLFSDMFSRAVGVSTLVAVAVMTIIQLENMLLRSKRRFLNMIERPAAEFTA